MIWWRRRLWFQMISVPWIQVASEEVLGRWFGVFPAASQERFGSIRSNYQRIFVEEYRNEYFNWKALSISIHMISFGSGSIEKLRCWEQPTDCLRCRASLDKVIPTATAVPSMGSLGTSGAHRCRTAHWCFFGWRKHQSCGGFHNSSWGVPNSWMVDFREKSHRSKWMRTGGSPIYGNPHVGKTMPFAPSPSHHHLFLVLYIDIYIYIPFSVMGGFMTLFYPHSVEISIPSGNQMWLAASWEFSIFQWWFPIWENRLWVIFEQTMFDYQRVNLFGVGDLPVKMKIYEPTENVDVTPL